MPIERPGPAALRRARKLGVLALYILATVQFVGAYLYLEFPYINVYRFERGYERLPFQTRLLLAPVYSYLDHSPWFVDYTSRLARNTYFFPQGLLPGDVFEFYSGIVCVLVAGWVAVRIYQASTRQRLLGAFVYPLFLALCAVSYILHTVQNFRFVYDMPSLAFFALGLYLIYFRKPVVLFVALFAVATLNRETTLLLLPFYALSQAIVHGRDGSSRINWRRIYAPAVLTVVLPLAAYWLAWHQLVFHIFAGNASEYYSRVQFNLHCFARLRYYPQLASSFGFLLPVLFFYRRHVHDPQLRAWMGVIPVWIGFMFTWGILVETRVFGELLPLIAPLAAVIAEDALYEKFERRQLESLGFEDGDSREQPVEIARAA
jgi:hypothetical protein